MAISVSWTPKASINYDPDDPVTTGLFGEIIDNEVYLYEWLGKDYDVGIENHNHDGINSAALNSNATAGDVPNFKAAGLVGFTSTSYVKVAEFVFPAGGEFRFKWTTTEGSAGVSAVTRVYRNGVAVGTEWTTDDATVTEDISGWTQGDLIQLYGKAETTPGSIKPTASLFRIFADDAYNATDTFT